MYRDTLYFHAATRAHYTRRSLEQLERVCAIVPALIEGVTLGESARGHPASDASRLRIVEISYLHKGSLSWTHWVMNRHEYEELHNKPLLLYVARNGRPVALRIGPLKRSADSPRDLQGGGLEEKLEPPTE